MKSIVFTAPSTWIHAAPSSSSNTEEERGEKKRKTLWDHKHKYLRPTRILPMIFSARTNSFQNIHTSQSDAKRVDCQTCPSHAKQFGEQNDNIRMMMMFLLLSKAVSRSIRSTSMHRGNSCAESSRHLADLPHRSSPQHAHSPTPVPLTHPPPSPHIQRLSHQQIPPW